jgi:hypothetical protein
MRASRWITALILSGLFSAQWVYGQKSTELYIPIGKSPGLSGKYTFIGKIETVDLEKRTITVGAPAGAQSVLISDQTKIWIDRSGLKQANVEGSFTDLQAGRRVEVKYRSYESKTDAEWVKVEAR